MLFWRENVKLRFWRENIELRFLRKNIDSLEKKTKKTYGYPQPNKINPYRLFFIWVQNPF